MYDIPYVWNLERNDTNEPTYKTERDSQKTNLQLPGGRDSREFGMDGYTLLYSKWITNKDLLYSTGNSAQHPVAAWMERKLEGECIHVYAWLSFFAVHLKLSQHCYLAIPQYQIKS